MSEPLITANEWADWIIKAFATAGIGLLGWFYRGISIRIDKLEDESSDKRTRIALLEAQADTFLQQLSRIEEKLDQLLTEERSRYASHRN